MKPLLSTALALSLMLNALLAWHWLHRPPAAMPPPVVRTVVVEKEKPAVPGMQWKQLEAPDFATYIANLRQAGCPESTLRAIIQPELRQVVRTQQHEAGSPLNEAALAAEETRLLESLLAVQPAAPAPFETGFSPDSPSVSTTAPRPVSATPSLTSTAPAAFLVGNAPDDPVLTPEGLSILPSDPALPPETRQSLIEMRREFGEQALSSSAADPSLADPEAQWRKARRASDDIFIARYGGDYFMRVQQQARLQEVLNAKKQGAP